MKYTMVLAAAVLLAGIGTADAAKRHKHKRVVHRAPVEAYMPASPYPAYRSRPVWAAPWQCFTDEGYGRFRPCDAGPTTR
jgi:hypothetical protein